MHWMSIIVLLSAASKVASSSNYRSVAYFVNWFYFLYLALQLLG
jgi:hypothetical protein